MQNQMFQRINVTYWLTMININNNSQSTAYTIICTGTKVRDTYYSMPVNSNYTNITIIIWTRN